MADRDSKKSSWRGRIVHIAIILAMFALSVMAWWSLYDGLSSGCFKAKYGYICHVDRPTKFVIQMALTAIAGLLYSAGCIIASVVLWDRYRFKY